MAFRQEDFKKTTRKSANGGPAAIYPHQIKDKAARAKLEVAIRLFDGLVGKRRGEMNAAALTDFLGDPRFARGVVACLGQYYAYKTPPFTQMVGAKAALLTEAGLGTPMALRAYTYAQVNQTHDGFLTEAGRAVFYGELGARFGLTAHDWDSLLHLDAEDNQILSRPGSVPTTADIAALYNFHALDTALRHAVKIAMTGFALDSAAKSDLRALAARHGLKVTISADGAGVTLCSLAPDGGELALSRCFLRVLYEYAKTNSVRAEVDILMGPKKFRLMLAPDALHILGAGQGVCEVSLRKRLEAGDALYQNLQKRRAKGEAMGWRITRRPEPVVTAQGVFLPDFTFMREGRRLCVALGREVTGPEIAPTLSLPLGRKPWEACDVLMRAEERLTNLFTLPAEPEPEAVPRELRTLCDRAVSEGMVRMADAQRVLHLLDESPLIDWVRRNADSRVRYVPGVGLCYQEWVRAIAASALQG